MTIGGTHIFSTSLSPGLSTTLSLPGSLMAAAWLKGSFSSLIDYTIDIHLMFYIVMRFHIGYLQMFLVGLTGGIASGKSSVSDMLRNMGCVILDADKIAREGKC